MLKANLFKNLYEAKPKTPKKDETEKPFWKKRPVPAVSKNVFGAAPDTSEEDLEDTMALPKAKRTGKATVSKKGSVKTAPVSGPAIANTFNKLRDENVSKAEKEREAEEATLEKKKAEDPNFGLSAKEKLTANKAQYGNVYVKNRATVDDLRADLETLPFRLSGKKSRVYAREIKDLLLIPDIINASAENPALKEVVDTLKNTKDFSILSTDDTGFANMASYVFFNAFVFPLVQPELIAMLFKRPNISLLFNNLSKAYKGSILNDIDFSPNVNFESLDHIADQDTKNIVGQIQNILQSDEEDTSEIRRQLSSGLQDVSTGLRDSIVKSVGGGKQMNEVARTIYYSILSKYLPFNTDLFEIDNKAAQDLMANMAAVPDLDKFLTDNANTLIRSRVETIEENPMLHKGTLVMNSKNSLAFAYAKQVKALQKKRKNTEATSAETAEKISRASLDFFKEALPVIPAIGNHFTKLDTILSKMAFDELSVGTLEQKSQEVANELHAFALSGLDVLSTELGNSAKLLNIFNTLAKKYPELEEKVRPEERTEYITNVYLAPFTSTLSSKLKEFAEITPEDLRILFAVAIAVTECEARELSVAGLKKVIEEYGKYVSKPELQTNDFRFQGFIFIRKVLAIDSLLLKANRLIKKTPKKELESTIAPKKAKSERNAAQDYLQSLTSARRTILDTKALLQNLPTKAFELFFDIRKAIGIGNADVSIITNLVSGISSDEDEAIMSDFFQKLVANLSTKYFGDTTGGTHDSLALLALNELNPQIINEYIKDDLVEKDKQSLLATDGVLVSKTEYYNGLTDDFIKFIDLAASIKKDYAGMKLVNGEPDLTFEIDPISERTSFFQSFFFGDLPNQIESNATIKLCMHKFILDKFHKIVAPSLAKVSSATILLPETAKNNPKAVAEIDAYFKGLYNTCTAGLKTALNEINQEILVGSGGQSVSLITVIGDTAEQSKVRNFIIPEEAGANFEKTTLWIGNLALDLMKRTKNVKSATQLFINDLAFASPSGQEEAQTSSLTPYVQNAIDIISTAINLKAAQNAMLGDDQSQQTIIELIKRYQKEGNEAGVTDIFQQQAIAKSMLDEFAKQSGFNGTEFITQKDNRVKNPLLASILDKFNSFVCYDSVERRLSAYQKDIQTSAEKGETDTADLGNVVVKLTGIVYKRVVQLGREGNKEMNAATKEENAGAVEEATPEGTPTGNKDIFDRSNPKAMKFKFMTAQRLEKDLQPRVMGKNVVPLGRDKKYGSNEAPIQSYSERIASLMGAISSATTIYTGFYRSVKSPDLEAMVKDKSEEAMHNCSILRTFFDHLKRFETVGIYNTGTQRTLMDLLQRLHGNAAISPRDLSATVEALDVEDNPLPELFKVADPTSARVQERLDEAFRRFSGSEHVLALLNTGLTIEQIAEGANKILLERGDDPDFLGMAMMEPQESFYSSERPVEPSPEDPRVKQAAPFTARPQNGPDNVANFLSSLNTIPNTHTQTRPIMKKDEKGNMVVSRPSEIVLNTDFRDKYATVFDKSLQGPGSPATPEEQKALRSAAIKLDAYLAKSPKIKAQLLAAIKDGDAYNMITNAPVLFGNLLNTAQLKEAFTNYEIACILLEADENVPEKPEKEEAVVKPLKAKDSSSQTTLVSLAAILRVKHQASGSPSGLLNKAGQPFDFSFLENIAWALPLYNRNLEKYLSVVNRYVEGPDAFEFLVNTGRAENRAYVRLFYFNKIKALVDNHYKPETEEVK